MLVTLAVFIAFGILGAVLVVIGPAEVGAKGIGSRLKRLSYIAGVSFLSTFLVLFMLAVISLTSLSQVASAFNDTFSNDTSEFGDYPMQDLEESPEIPQEWDDW